MMQKIRYGFVVALFLGLFLPTAFSQKVKPPVKQQNPDTTIVEIPGENLQDNMPTISIDESEEQDVSSQNISSQLAAGRDPFLNAATFKFSAVRFRIRGYDANEFNTFINGALMMCYVTGKVPWG